MPENAKDVNATAIPKTHFTNYRPVLEEKEGKYEKSANENQVVSKDLGANFNNAHYYCTLCHVPQTNATGNVGR